MAEQKTTGLELLNEIKPPTLERRFLQSWDDDSRILRFGCGDREKAVWIGSDGSVEATKAQQPTKLEPSTVRAFLDGNQPENPFDAVCSLLKEYVYFDDERIYTFLTTWIVGTYVYSIFSHYGYAFLHSMTPRCGKTRTEEVTSHLAFEATTPRNAPTPPSMRETVVAGGTAIFDTLERWREKGQESFGAAMELLDAGFRRGGEVTKMVRAGEGEWKQDVFPVYAPYMFAAIDKESITETALDRSFEIAMARKSTRLMKLPYDARCEKKCRPIRTQLYMNALIQAGPIADAYGSDELRAKVDAIGLNDRAVDIWKPLIAVVTVLQPGSVDALVQLAQEMSPDPDRKEEQRQLAAVRALRTLVGENGALSGPTQRIIDQVRNLTGFEVRDLHNLLSEWGFKEKSMRLEGLDSPRKGWEISDVALADVEDRLKSVVVPG